MDEAATEARLEREARDVCMGHLSHKRVTGDDTNVRVEVSWEDAEGVEHAGYFKVKVPNIEPTGDEFADVSSHPASLAEDVVERELERRAEEFSWGYTSIDDVGAW